MEWIRGVILESLGCDSKPESDVMGLKKNHSEWEENLVKVEKD